MFPLTHFGKDSRLWLAGLAWSRCPRLILARGGALSHVVICRGVFCLRVWVVQVDVQVGVGQWVDEGEVLWFRIFCVCDCFRAAVKKVDKKCNLCQFF